jgi:hypothetical protein
MNSILDAGRFHLRMHQVTQHKHVRSIAEFLVVAICTVAFALNAAGICATLLTDNYAGARDFVTYWSSGQQLARHANPYDGQAILRLEHTVGFSAGLSPLIMRNPPPSLLVVLPLGILGIRAASLLWSVMMLASLWLSVRMIAAMHERRKSLLNYLAYTFAPVLSCLIAGQMALFVLLGLTFFLRLHRTYPLLAGASLWLCFLKPHLFLPFGVVLLAWIIVSRCYRILLGAAIAFGLSTLLVAVMDRFAWVHYAQMMRAAKIDTAVIPCVSMMLRLMVSPNSAWLQYLPAALACVWAIAYFRRHRDDWDWMEHGSLLMLVSMVVAPYSWFMDQAVLLPALLHALYQNRSRSLVAILALASAVIEIANFRGVPLGNSILYPWTALVWLAWYLYTVRRARPDAAAKAEIGPAINMSTAS